MAVRTTERGTGFARTLWNGKYLVKRPFAVSAASQCYAAGGVGLAAQAWRSECRRPRLALLEFSRCLLRPRGQPRNVDVIGVLTRIAGERRGAPTQQGRRTNRVSPRGMGEPDGELGQALPECPLAVGR